MFQVYWGVSRNWGSPNHWFSLEIPWLLDDFRVTRSPHPIQSGQGVEVDARSTTDYRELDFGPISASCWAK